MAYTCTADSECVRDALFRVLSDRRNSVACAYHLSRAVRNATDWDAACTVANLSLVSDHSTIKAPARVV